MIIDAHAHIFPDKIRQAAVSGISSFYDIPIPYDGSVETLLSLGTQFDIAKFLILSVATTPEQVSSINSFLAQSVQAHPDSLVGFMALHPDFDDIQGEIQRAAAMGLKGIKLHPDFQKFAIDDPRVYPIYEAAGDKFPILIHMGDPRYAYSKPKRLAKVLEDFPKLKVIAAHFGGWSEWGDAVKYLKGHRVWVDSCSTSHWLSPKETRSLIDFYGSDYVLFGTDYPMWTHKEELEALEQLKLPAAQMDRILYKNAAALLGI